VAKKYFKGSNNPAYSVVTSVEKENVLKDEALPILEGFTRKGFKRSNNPAYSASATVTKEI
jgi:hypothetical protein